MTLNMKKIAYIACSMLLLAGASACSDWMDIQQHGTLTPENFYQTDEDASAAVAAAYASLANLEFYHRTINGYMSDEFWQNLNDHGGNLHEFFEYTGYYYGANDQYIRELFTGLYNLVGKCNLVLEYVKGDSHFQQQAIAEARVLRSMAYFELTTLWETPPVVDHILSADEAAQPNGDPARLWKLMEDDLKAAIESNSLTQKASLEDRSNYRVTRQFAQALLGKVYLWQGKNSEAAAVLDQVIGSGLYALVQPSEIPYGDIPQSQYNNNKESMFESNFVLDKDNNTFRLIAPSCGLCVYTRSGYDERSGEANILHLYYNTWGGFSPRSGVYEAFVAEEGVDGYRLSQTIKTYDYMASQGYSMKADQQEFSEGFFMWKGRYMTSDADMTATLLPNLFRNFCWMRYAEVLLMAAEANIGIDQGKADKYLKEVRDRVGLPAKTCDLAAIKTERRLELFGESVRFKDLLRWGDAETVLADFGKEEPVLTAAGLSWKNFSTTYGFKSKHKHLPFPEAEVLANRNLNQHSDWE